MFELGRHGALRILIKIGTLGQQKKKIQINRFSNKPAFLLVAEKETPHPGGMQIKAESTSDAETHKITNKPGGKSDLFVKEQASSNYTEIECKIAGKDT